jgi:HK97 gp10 family phage protein
MPVTSTVQVKGLSELLRNMEQLPRELVSNRGGLVRSALFRAAKTVRDEAKQRAPRDTGALQASVIATRDKNPQAAGANERYLITVKKKRWTPKAKAKAQRKASGKIDYRKSGDAFYWRFVEFGTSKMRAQPFLRPAFESQKDVALDEFKHSLGAGIQRVVRKMNKAKP